MLGDAVRRNQKSAGRRRVTTTRGAGRSRRARLLVVLGAALVPFVVGYVIAVAVIFPAPEIAGQGVTVPSLVGMSTDEASQTLAGLGLGALEITSLPHPNAPRGTITAQSPLAGQQLAGGRAVRVSVSSGTPYVVVPDVIGFPIERGASLLTRLGFQIRRVEEPAAAEAGRVVRLEPQPGAQLPLPSTVTIFVSTGPERSDPAADTVSIDTLTAGPARR